MAFLALLLAWWYSLTLDPDGQRHGPAGAVRYGESRDWN